MKSFNKLAEPSIKDRVLERTFEKFWPELDSAYQLLFPDSHREAREVAQPLHIVPQPTAAVVSPPPQRRQRRKDREDGPGEHAQAGLFNGKE